MTALVIGNGDIATAIKELLGDNPRPVTYFASGVSNSHETRRCEFEREADLLLAQDHGKHLVYFSTLSIYYASSVYVEHKKAMERLVREHFPCRSIIRIGNITWGTNPHTLLNFFRRRILSCEPFEVRDTHRYLISKAELIHWLKLLPLGRDQNELCITGRMVHVPDLVKDMRSGLP